MLGASLPRVVVALVQHETFGGEATLAALVVVLCLVLLAPYVRRRSGRRSGR